MRWGRPHADDGASSVESLRPGASPRRFGIAVCLPHVAGVCHVLSDGGQRPLELGLVGRIPAAAGSPPPARAST